MATFHVEIGTLRASVRTAACSSPSLTVLVRPTNLALGMALLKAFTTSNDVSPNGPVQEHGDLLVIDGETDVATVVERLYRGPAGDLRRYYWRFAAAILP